MKKLTQSLSVYDFPPATVYLDDIAAIYQLLCQLAQQVEIECKDTAFESLDELAQYGQTIPMVHELEFHCTGPYISFSLGPDRIRMYASVSTLELQGAASSLRQIIAHRKKALAILYSAIGPFIPGAILGPFLVLAAIGWPQPILVATGAVGVILGVLVFRQAILSSRQYCTIVLKYKAEAPSFLERKKDDILLVVITAVVTGIATFIATYLLK